MSDHRLLQAGLGVVIIETGAQRTQKSTPGVSRPWSVSALGDRSARVAYKKDLQRAFRGYAPQKGATADQFLTEFVQRFEKAACRHINRRETNSGKKTVPSWYTGEVRDAVALRRALWAKIRAEMAQNTPAQNDAVAKLWKEYREQAAAVTRLSWKSKRASWDAVQSEISDLVGMDAKSFWDKAKRMLFDRGSNASVLTGAIRDTRSGELVFDGPEYLEAWRTFFSSLGNAPFTYNGREAKPKRLKRIRSFLSGGKCDGPRELRARITSAEVRRAIRQTKLGKAGGPDGWCAEMFSFAGIDKPIARFLNALWRTEKVPASWGVAIIITLPKSGDLTNMANYRGISLLNNMAKLFGRVLVNRLMHFLESNGKLTPAQSGFRPKRGCSDNLFTLIEGLREYRATGQHYLVAFLDIKKAFDRVWRDGLWYKLDQIGVKGRMLRVLRSLYDVHQARVRVNGEHTDVFDIGIGTKQGDTLAFVVPCVY